MFLQKEKGFIYCSPRLDQRNRCPKFKEHKEPLAPPPWGGDRPGRVTGEGQLQPRPARLERGGGLLASAWCALGRGVVRTLALTFLYLLRPSPGQLSCCVAHLPWWGPLPRSRPHTEVTLSLQSLTLFRVSMAAVADLTAPRELGQWTPHSRWLPSSAH